MKLLFQIFFYTFIFIQSSCTYINLAPNGRGRTWYDVDGIQSKNTNWVNPSFYNEYDQIIIEGDLFQDFNHEILILFKNKNKGELYLPIHVVRVIGINIQQEIEVIPIEKKSNGKIESLVHINDELIKLKEGESIVLRYVLKTNEYSPYWYSSPHPKIRDLKVIISGIRLGESLVKPIEIITRSDKE